MAKINYAIEVHTDKTKSANYAYGFDGSVFRWVTGRPQYDGSTIVPTWEDGTPNTDIWTEGWILQDEIGEPIRSVDISSTGNYGTLSGFNFSLCNNVPAPTADPLWKWVRDNRIYFTNRDITLYIIIDDVFYAIWSGVVENNPMEEIEYKFKCIDSSNKIHKVMPPLTVNRNVLPNSDDESQGKPIPISIGDVTYAKILTITNEPSEEVVVQSTPLANSLVEGKACAALEYNTKSLVYPYLKLYTKNKVFPEHALKDKFIYVVRGGGFADVDILNKIVDSYATTALGTTTVLLESPFEFVDQETFNTKYSYDPYYLSDKIKYYPEVAADYSYITRYMIEPEASYFSMPGVSSSLQYPINQVVPLDKSNWIRYTHVDMSNGGVGCSQVNLFLAISPLWDCTITIRKDTYDGDIIGQKKYLIMDIPTSKHWEYVPIDRQYGDDVTLVIQVTGGIIHGNYYHDFTPHVRVQQSIFDRPPTFNLYMMSVSGSESSEDTWWFSIVGMGGTHLISNNTITEIVTDNGKDTGLPLLYVYDKNRKVMDPVPNNIYSVVVDKTGASGHPEFILYSSNIRKDGEVQYLATIMPKRWSIEVEPDMAFKSRQIGWQVVQYGHIEAAGISVPMINQNTTAIYPQIDLCNRNQKQFVEIRYPDFFDYQKQYSFTIKLEYPKEYLAFEVEEIYVCIDAEFQSLPAVPSITPVPIRLIWYIDVLDPYGNVINQSQYQDIDADNDGDLVWPTDQAPASDYINLNTLPSVYYDNGGVKEAGYSNQWNYVGKDKSDEDVTLRSMLKLKSELWDMIRDGSSSNIIQVRVICMSHATSYKGGEPFSLYVKVKEAGIMGIRTTNPLNDDYYCRLRGEKTVDGLQTNNVYTAFKLMMETYDGIPASKIDYTNLPVVRADWTVGRQITESKSSKDYIKELAQHSFVGVYPKRDGARGLKAWREDTDLVKSFSSSDIIRDTIKGWQKTDVADLYNSFELWYNWSPAANTYIDSISLTYTDKYYPVVGGVTAATAGFPGTTMMTDYPATLELWKTYVGGVSPNSYTDAEYMWKFAHESYDIAGAVQPLSKNLSEMPWYINTKLFNSETFEGASKSDSPFMYLQNLSEWCTLQKDEVKFNVPLTIENVRLELLDYIAFSDPIYTNDEVRNGWVTAVEFVPTKNYMRLTAVLAPDPVIVDRVIRERGQLLNFNLYTESGTETGVLVDGQGRI